MLVLDSSRTFWFIIMAFSSLNVPVIQSRVHTNEYLYPTYLSELWFKTTMLVYFFQNKTLFLLKIPKIISGKKI